MLKKKLSEVKFYGVFKTQVNDQKEVQEFYNSIESENFLYETSSNYVSLLLNFGIKKNDIKIEDSLFCAFNNKHIKDDVYLLLWFPEQIFNYGFRYKLARTSRTKNPSLCDPKHIILLGHGNDIEEVEKTNFKGNIEAEKDCFFILNRKISVDPKILAIQTGSSSGESFKIIHGFRRDYKNVTEYMSDIINNSLKKYY